MVFMGGRNLTPHEILGGSKSASDPHDVFHTELHTAVIREGRILSYFTELAPPDPYGFHGGLNFDPPWFSWGVGC